MHRGLFGVRRVVVPSVMLAVLAAMFQAVPAHAQTTFTVTSTGDAADANLSDGTCNDGAGNCTLRAAIQEANAIPLDDLIHFDLAGTAPYIISPATALPSITEQVTIDATTEPDYPTPPFTTTPAAPVVVLDGSAIPDPGTDGLTLDTNATNSVIRGLRIVNFVEAGIHTLEGADGVQIQANQIGTDGTDRLPNGTGVLIESDTATIGGSGTNEGNLISGNGDLGFGSDNGHGIHLGPLSSFTTIGGNLIGTNAAGDAAVPNENSGITVEGNDQQVGGATAADRNVISGNTSRGIWVNGSSATDVFIQGNFIGTNASGTAALVPLTPGPVQGRGVETSTSGVVTIGSSVPGTTAEGNVISGNEYGVYLSGTSSSVVGDNLIGTATDDTTAIGNSQSGVVIQGFSTFPADTNHVRGNTIAASDFYGVFITSDATSTAATNVVTENYIGTNAAGDDLGNARSGVYIQETGGDTTPNDGNLIGGPAEGNTIAFNDWDGVEIEGANADNSIRENLIYGNGTTGNDIGIDLGPNGRTDNDGPGDPDTGANTLQNFPVLETARASSDEVTYSLESTSNTTFEIDFFAASSCPAVGGAQAETFLGVTTATTDPDGATETLTFASPVALTSGDHVTATATDPTGNTSELADCVLVSDVADLEVGVSASETVVAGQQVDAVVTVTNDGPDAASDVQIDITLPAGADQATASSATSGVDCDTSVPGTVSCATTTLAASDSFDVDLTFRSSTTPGMLTTSATAASAATDPDGASGSDVTDASDASPGFAPATSYRLAGDDAHSVVTGDFDGDDEADMVVTNPGSGTASFLKGDGDGGFGDGNTSDADDATAITVGGEPRFAAAGDFDGDDNLDLIVNTEDCSGTGPEGCGTFTFLAGNGDGTFDTAISIDVDNRPRGLAAAHLNADGHLDLVAATGRAATVNVYLGSGTGSFSGASYGGTGGQYGIALADVDGDGDRDVLATSPTELSVLKNNGSGVLAPRDAYPLSAPTTSTPWPVILDANEDTIADVAVSGNAELLIGKADGTFEAAAEKLTSPDAFFLAEGDFNGDGRADLEAAVDAPAAGESDLVQLRGRGTGAFVDGHDALLQYDATNSLASGDLNDDGFTDLLVPHGGDDRVTVLVSNATVAISGLAITTDTATLPAGFSSIDTRTLDFSRISYVEGTLEASAGPLAAPIPAKPIPAKPIPAKPIPAKPIPAKPIPAKPIPAKFFGGGTNTEEVTPLADVPLSALLNHPIAEPPSLTLIDVAGGWQAKLANTAFANTPLQNLNLNDVIALAPVAATPIEDFDFSLTALGSLPPSALLYGETPLVDIGLPAGSDWTSLLSEMVGTEDYPCIGTISVGTNPPDPNTLTLVDLALARCPIALAPWDDMRLADVSLTEANSPLYGFNFSAIDVSKIPQLAGIELADLPAGIVDCSITALDCDPGGDTLGTAQAYEFANESVFFADATFGPLADAGLLGDMTLGDLLLGVIQPDGFPYENVPLHELLAAATPSATGAVTYTVAFTLTCPVPAATQVIVALPDDSFGYVVGSTVVKAGGVDVPTASVDPADDGEGHLSWDAFGGVCGTGSANVTLAFKAQPSPTIGSYVAHVAVETGAGDTFRSSTPTPLSLTEPNEPNDTPPGQASSLQTGFLMPGGFTTAGDIDYVKVPVAAADEGALVTVYLSHFSADDDLVGYGSVPENLASAPIPAKPIPAKSVGDQEGCLPPGYVLQPQTLENVPQVVNTNFAVRGFSTNRSDQEEIVCTTVQPGDVQQGYVLLQITHHTGATLGDTYLVRATKTPPPDLGPCEGPDLSSDTGVTYGSGDYDRTIAATNGSFPLTGDTLFLINEDRFGDLYGVTEEQQTLAKLNQLAHRPDVDGYILPVENRAAVAAAYATLDLDDNACSPDAANQVVSEITQLISSVTAGRMPKYVVIVGGDPIVPLARLQDLTTLGNQVAYAQNLVLGEDQNGDPVSNPIARAFARGMYLSDSPYGTRFAIPWVGNLVYIPDAGVGRLVETPDDIQATIQRYLDDADGQLDPKTAFVTGTDSSIPTAKAIRQQLQSRANRLNDTIPGSDPYSVESLIDSPAEWTKAQAICRLKGYEDANCTGAGTEDFEPPGIVSWNAHFDHFRTLAGNEDVNDLFTTQDLVDSVGQPDIVFFTIGCNAGVNVPDVYLSLPTNGEDLDWAQAIDGVFLGNNGYGYGDTTRTAFSERMMQLFAARLDEDLSLGEADKLARGTYWAELGAVSPYDVKSIQEATFYGLPMWSVSGASVTPPGGKTVTTDPQTGLPSSTVSLPTGNDDFFVDPDEAPDGDLITTPDGQYFTGPRTQVTPGKPIEPLSHAIEMTATDEDLQLRGALVTQLEIRDIEDFDPVIARTHLDGGFAFFEPFVASGSFPTDLLNVTSVQGNDFIVLYGGRFTADAFGFGVGTQRIHLSETVRGLYAEKSDPDFTPPTILGGQGQLLGNGFATFSVNVADPDVAAAFVLYRPTGSDTFRLHKLPASEGGLYQATVSVPQGVDEFLFQVADQSGNVAFDTFKGASQELLTAPEPPAGIDITITSDTPPTDGWYSGDVDVTISSPYFTFISASLDGGPSTFTYGAPLTVHIEGVGGVHRVDYETGLGNGVVFVPIDDSPPEITRIVGTPSSGEDPTYVSPDTEILIRVEDPSGIQACSIEITDPNGDVSEPACGEGDNPVTLDIDGLYTIVAAATDNAGNSTTETFRFRVVRDSEPPTVTPSVPGAPKYTSPGGTTFVTSTTNLRMNVIDTLAEGVTPGSGVASCSTSFGTNGVTAAGQVGAPPGPPALVPPANCDRGDNDYRITTATPDGPYRLQTGAVDKVDNATDGAGAPNDVTLDNTAPVFQSCPNPGSGILVRTDVGPIAGAFYLNAPTPTLTIQATDQVFTNVPGSGLNTSASTLSRTLTTSQVGTFKLTYTAVDNLGNTRTKDCFYEVIYKFTGFFNPISNTNLNVVTAGKAVAVKWRILDHFNNPVAAPASFNDGRGVGVSDPAVCNVTAFGISQNFKGNSMLQYQGAGNWQFNWAVPKSFAGQCRTMTLRLKGDALVLDPGALDRPYRSANFQFKAK